MQNNNLLYTGISTDSALSSILDQFSDDTIINQIILTMEYKFRPFGTRIPNYPYILKSQFDGISGNYFGDNPEAINIREQEIFNTILDFLCKSYQLTIATDIPDEQVYPLVYTLYQILVSEFTERMLAFFSDHIVKNKEVLLNSIPDDQKVSTRSTYTKKIYVDPVISGVYENMDKILDLVASLDIPFVKLMEYLAGTETANFLGSYLADVGDIYKNHFASYVLNPNTRTDMITSIKIRFTDATVNSMGPKSNIDLYAN